MAETPCRCLLRDREETRPLWQIVEEYVQSLPEEERAEESIRAGRLERCRVCPHLAGGTCVLCGCYVEARAAKRRLGCPAVPPRWTPA